MNLNELTIKEAVEGLKNKKFSSVELTESCLKRIGQRNTEINAFISVNAEEALLDARTADILIGKKKAGTIAGIPFAVKDAICTVDLRSTGAAKILDNYIPPYEATVIRRLREAGGVVIGKNNCDAFGHGASNENSMYGAVRNPYDISKVAGGSSGGSAAAVSDNECIFSIAEDTGGSIRQPAAFCGVVGLRPSYGRNSRFGIMPMASSLDTVGPIAKSVEDIALLMEIMAGRDPKDATTVNEPVPLYSKEIEKNINGMKVGVPEEYFNVKGIDKEIIKATEKEIEKLRDLGCKIVPVSLPHTKYAIAAYYIIVPSEDSSNLARLDGVRYGERVKTKNLFDLYAKSRAIGFPEEVKRRILIGTYALSAGYYDAYYKKAQKVRTLIKNDFEEAFKKVDAIITPTTPSPAFGVGEMISDPLSMYLADAMVSPAAMAGVPALSVPAGMTKAGLPIGVQIIGARLNESAVLRIGYSLQK
ncbi:MAG: Asp-tRNA(Asn)/Glu-tRNA(Gln) amidotransferase subunit GatA [Candidatus Magasanikbacteria bacterium]|nr:Asp-tRNA(Asn)/Glu-tRNA(Gln) amidotransferase subunit GatA [Candidatus Magasanikbacteria bacterium]